VSRLEPALTGHAGDLVTGAFRGTAVQCHRRRFASVSAQPSGTSIALLSLIVLVPCFWQHRIQAGDLGSHIYNSWLAQQISMGKAPDLAIAPVTTNVLFDWILSCFFRNFGPELAQRIAVSIAVLIFFWGAFAVVWSASGARPWFLTPCLCMLTYGWTFHMGFFNFYLAAGLSLWALALSLRRRAIWRVATVALLAAAYSGNPIAPAWVTCVIFYTWAARRLAWRLRFLLFTLA